MTQILYFIECLRLNIFPRGPFLLPRLDWGLMLGRVSLKLERCFCWVLVGE